MSWNLDPAHTEITFSVRHMMVSNVRGRFERFEADVNANEEHPEQSHISVQIDAGSIDTREAQRDAHLRSADFLDAENFPHITFRSTRIEPLSDHHGKMYGDLTIRDVTRPVVLDVDYNGQYQNPWGMMVAGFSAVTSISRREWGLTWNVALEAGGWLVGDEIKISIEVELNKQPVAAPEPTHETATAA
ncbi:MAG: YceI family protein [Chloroflexota bacterium]